MVSVTSDGAKIVLQCSYAGDAGTTDTISTGNLVALQVAPGSS